MRYVAKIKGCAQTITRKSKIGNNPFYSPLQWYICGPYNPLIIGSGLSVNSNTAYITSSGGGGGAVTGIFAGSGINVSGNTGNVTVSNTGVTALTAGAGVSLSSSAGAVTITNTNNCNGTVTGINTGAGLTGGPITTSGTINLAISGVTAGVYTNPTLTVDSCGRILLASNNTVVNTISVTPPLTISGTTSPTLGVALGTTAGVGVVQLSSSVNDAASVCAATTAAVKTAYDIAIAAIPKTCITGQGALITGTAASTPLALPVGSNGTVLTACSSCTGGLYWGANSPTSTPNYGSFYTATTQTLATVNTPQPIQFLTLDSATNFSVVSNTRVTAAAAGVYNVQFSLQLLATPGGGGDYEVWPAINGTPIPNSNTRFSVKNTNEAECAALNYIITLTAGQYIELYWATDDTSNLLVGTTSLYGGPDIPSAIITIVPVGA